LGREPAADERFRALLVAARKRARTPVRIEYFATSLPSLLLFDDDLDARNRTECRYLTGLAQLGLGNASVARRAFRDVLAADPNHVGAAARLREPA